MTELELTIAMLATFVLILFVVDTWLMAKGRDKE